MLLLLKILFMHRFDNEMQVYERVRDMMPPGKSMPPTSRLNPYLEFGHANPGKPVKKKGKRKNRADDVSI